ncbi:MAG: lamin tail domain-containing protein [Verrucomicrobia bacterium]|nr:lamin tail domain-containing protein [Verrucomicrobiota bacterium]
MKSTFLCAFALGLSLQLSTAADSVVVFNEINYHPTTNESAHEWIELHNQMAIDIDLSAWSVRGGVDFTFAEGTIIPGGGHLVVAANPAALQTAIGLTNAVGPFTGRLNNSSARLELRDRNGRIMDRFDYGDEGKWPIAPDGSGATLAKRDPNSPSDSPDYWTSSVVSGGTPGGRNFPKSFKPQRRTYISFDSLWRFEASGTDLGDAWRAPGFDDSAWGGRNSATLVGYWPFNGDAIGLRGTSGTFVGAVATTTDRNGAADGALGFAGNLSQHVSVPGGGGLNAASQGTISLWVKWNGTQDADCCGGFGAVLSRQANGQFSDTILALNNANPASARLIWRQSGGPAPILITSSTPVGTNWHHIAITFSPAGTTLYVDGVADGFAVGSPMNNGAGTPLAIGAWAGDGGGFSTSSIDDVAVWDRPLNAAQVATLSSQTKTPLDYASPEGAVYYSGDGRLAQSDELRLTALPTGPTTYYFRNTFQFGDDPSSADLKLDFAADDGAIFYLNGQEVHRHNMPAGPATYSTLASSTVGDAAILNGISIPNTHLVVGNNVLAVEVHQASADDPGMVFGAGLNATVVPLPQGPPPIAVDPGTLVFNELGAGGLATVDIELINRGKESIGVGGYILRRTGTSPDAEFVLPPQTVPAGEFLTLNQTALGFTVAAGDKLFLLPPGGSRVADAKEVHSRPRARVPDGYGDFLTPTVLTPGTSNIVSLRDEIVINEIFYHGPPTLEVPATIAPTTNLFFTNLWRYEQSGTDLGTEWREPGYDDSAWPIGAGLFFVSTNNLAAPKNTPLTLGPTTYYFRSELVYTGTPAILTLNARHIMDDGIVVYLNGREILRANMPLSGPIRYTNFANTPVSVAAIRTAVPVALTNLILGTNIIAAEVHQASVSGDDVVFGFELSGTIEATPRIPYQGSDEEWLELFNQSSNAVSLAGWRLDEGIDFRFGTNDSIPPGGYLVVAKDPAALQAKFPGVPVVGPYDNRLSHSGERVVLRDASDNPADSVTYSDDGRWPGAADAGGASLELRDPRADNNVGESWAASDESNRSSWRTYSYRGVAAASPVGPDGQWKEFVMGLLDNGVILLDDIAVIETPSTTPTNLIQNGTFETGTNKWRIIGNHHGEVIDDPDQPGNKVLKLTANGSTEHMSNHGETTLAGGRDTVNGREYLITFRAKWISGSRQFHTRLYFNRLARTTYLEAPEQHGTPGSQNTAFVPNIGPSFDGLRHSPAVPGAFEPVTVSVHATDPDGLNEIALWWRPDGGDWSSIVMVPSAESPGIFSASLPGRPAGSIVQFYVDGADGHGVRSFFPADGANSRALYRVDDGLAATNGLHNFRLVTLTEDSDQLFRTVNLMSNERIGCTVIYDEQEIFYDVGLRLKGSEHSRTTTPRLGFNVSFPSAQKFRGIHSTVALDRSESTGFGQREMLIHQTLNHVGGVPTKYHDLVQIMAPRPDYTGTAELQLARYSDVFLDDQFEDGADGTVFEYELVYQLNSTDTGTPEGNKVPNPDSVVGTTIRNLGDDKENYRWTMLLKNNEDRDDYARIMAFSKWMATTGTNFTSQLTNVIDVDRWLRGTAANVVSGAGDSYGGDGSQHNVQFYVRPSDGRVIYFPHDVDAFFDASRPAVPNGDLSKILAIPAYARAYYGHLREILETTYNANYMTRWANHFGRLLPAQNFAGHLAFIVQRGTVLNNAINTAVPNVAFNISSSGGNNFGTTSNTITFTGTAPLAVRSIEVNGVSYPITWTSATAWSIQLPLFSGLNPLVVQGVDRSGIRLTNAIDTITITNNGSGVLLPVVINEWMADNAGPSGLIDPADGLFQDWFELFNPNTNAVNLAGFYLTDTLSQPAKWQIPLGTVIDPGAFLLVWADNEPEQNISYPTNGHLHAGFQLSANGEVLALYSPGLVAQHAVVFGPQFQNVSQGLFPDGMTNSVYSMTNWTPRTANSLANREILRVIAFNGTSVTLQTDVIAGRNYAIEFKNSLAEETWQPLGDPRSSAGATLTVTDTTAAPLQRFYRIKRLD